MSGTFGSDHHHHYRGDTRYLYSMVTTNTHPAKTNANLQDSESDPYNYFQTRDQSSNVKELADIREVRQTNKDFMDLQIDESKDPESCSPLAGEGHCSYEK